MGPGPPILWNDRDFGAEIVEANILCINPVDQYCFLWLRHSEKDQKPIMISLHQFPQLF